MLQPQGPLPPEVYWRRRALALAAVVVVVVLLIWLVAALAGDGSEQPVQPAAQLDPSTSTTASDSPVLDSLSGAGAASASEPGASASGGSGPAAAPGPLGGVAPAVARLAALAADSAVTMPAASGSPATAVPPAAAGAPVDAAAAAAEAAAAAAAALATPPPGPPQPCADVTTVVAAQPAQPEYRVGTRPVLTLTVTNISPVACTRDLDASLQELLLFAADGVTRLWSSNDCYPGDSVDVRILRPGETVSFPVTWAGRSSQPGCAVKRAQIGPGDYFVVAKLGPLTSPPVPLRLTP